MLHKYLNFIYLHQESAFSGESPLPVVAHIIREQYARSFKEILLVFNVLRDIQVTFTSAVYLKKIITSEKIEDLFNWIIKYAPIFGDEETSLAIF